ncbi:hypothetical protein [Salicola sp. Rm-C-2C1-2]|uniref:tetratricopeptide repeat protein n=1 Tax=Salicola sp. Rm-C-2C1-2 TaxID=3141321 RepID=UPI0032E47859
MSYKEKVIEKLANAGYAWAQCELARLKIDRDDEAVIYWYTKAAEQGYPPAFLRLSAHYHLGKRVEQDLMKALKLLLIAEIRSGRREREMCHEISERLDRGQVKEAQRQAGAWFVGAPL